MIVSMRARLWGVLASIAVSSCGGSIGSSPSDGGLEGGPTFNGGDASAADASDGSVAGEASASMDSPAATDSPAETEAGPPLSLTDVCDGVAGLTGQSVLDGLQPTYAATFTYQGGASTALTITTRYAGGPITCHPALISMGGPPDTPAWVEVQMQITFATANGAFNESFSTPVDWHFTTTRDFDAPVPASAIKGTYKPTLTGFATIDISFGGSFSGTTTTGIVVEQGMNGNMGQTSRAGSWQ
jgi:hypothetical protein